MAPLTASAVRWRDDDIAHAEESLREALAGSMGDRDATLFRILVLQRHLGLADEAVLAETAERISLRRFCGLAMEDAVPSIESLRRLRTALLEANAMPLVERAASALACTPLLSIVSPVYQAEETVDELVRQITAAVEPLSSRFEIILVDDGSRDQSWQRIREAAARDARVRGIRLSRNFGQHVAITAGIDRAAGDWVVVMDCDLQDDPRDIPGLLASGRAGHDVVYAIKRQRRHRWIKNLFGRLFALAFRWTAGGAASANVGSFSLLSRRAADAFREVRDAHRHYLRVVEWLGFRSAYVPVEHRARYRGRSTYTVGRLLRHAVVGLTAYSDRLLYLALGVGALFLAVSIVAAAFLVIMYLQHGYREGWTSTIVLILLSTSMVLFSIGTVGIYVGKIFDQVKPRPLYLTGETVNL